MIDDVVQIVGNDVVFDFLAVAQLKANRHRGMAASLTLGDEMNFKITMSGDLQIFRSLVERER